MDISIHGDKKNTEGKKILLRIQFSFLAHMKIITRKPNSSD